jgi:hypothetical protein
MFAASFTKDSTEILFLDPIPIYLLVWEATIIQINVGFTLTLPRTFHANRRRMQAGSGKIKINLDEITSKWAGNGMVA